jgi:hypothetical protein
MLLANGKVLVAGFVSTPLAAFSGPASVTVIVNGIPSPAFAAANQAISFDCDTDGDGPSDGAENHLASLGFDFAVNQAAMVNAMFSFRLESE